VQLLLVQLVGAELHFSLVQLVLKAMDIVANDIARTITDKWIEPSAGILEDLSFKNLTVVSASKSFAESLPESESSTRSYKFREDDQIKKKNLSYNFTPDVNISVTSEFDNHFEPTDEIQETPNGVKSVLISEYTYGNVVIW